MTERVTQIPQSGIMPRERTDSALKGIERDLREVAVLTEGRVMRTRLTADHLADGTRYDGWSTK